jgi:hypothetical protein
MRRFLASLNGHWRKKNSLLNIIFSWVIRGAAAVVDRVLALIDANVVDEHLSGELKMHEIGFLETRCNTQVEDYALQSWSKHLREQREVNCSVPLALLG